MNNTEKRKSEIKEQIWAARNQYIKSTQGYREPDTLIIHIADWFKLREEIGHYEIMKPDGTLIPFFGMDIIRTEDIEKGVFTVK